jgi:hypothetical protein
MIVVEIWSAKSKSAVRILPFVNLADEKVIPPKLHKRAITPIGDKCCSSAGVRHAQFVQLGVRQVAESVNPKPYRTRKAVSKGCIDRALTVDALALTTGVKASRPSLIEVNINFGACPVVIWLTV